MLLAIKPDDNTFPCWVVDCPGVKHAYNIQYNAPLTLTFTLRLIFGIFMALDCVRGQIVFGQTWRLCY